jgi:hypothetical protein
MEVSGQLHALAALLPEKIPVRLIEETVRAPEYIEQPMGYKREGVVI